MVPAYAVPSLERWPVRGLAGLITLYQRYLSPYKGFCCAHRALHGGASCSAHAKTLLLRRGFVRACRGMRARFPACGAAAAELDARAQARRRQIDSLAAHPEATAQCCASGMDVVSILPSADGCASAAACLSF
jgi:putative component of membrane protein insertase Oxa1/YidC/SpoIIIJ protein YidD